MRSNRSFHGHLPWLVVLGALSAPACGSSVPPAGSGGGVGTGGVPTGSGGADAGSGGLATTGGSTGSGSGPATGGVSSTGGAGAAPGSGGDTATGGSASGGSPGLTLVEPIVRAANRLVLEFGDYLFEVDPTHGARVVTFSFAGTNLLRTAADAELYTGGATFWLSPQVTWDWPPVPEIDGGAYEATVAGSTIEAVGATASIGSASVHVEKSFSPDLVNEGIDIVYEIHNDGAAPASFAPWEISRHARGGLTFWPGARAPDAGAQWEFEPTLVSGVYYWDDAGKAEADVKVSADGEQGWVAHVAGDLLFVKTWTPVPAADIALDQGEVELYLGDGFVEVEMQGPEAAIAAGAATSFAVKWFVRALPEGTDVSVGSTDLLAAVEAVLP